MIKTKMVLGYCRISTDNQKNGFSILAQKNKIHSYCSMKKLNLNNILVDEAFSGGNMNRPSINKIINLVKSDKVSHLICFDTSRISRNLSNMSNFMDLLHEHQVKFHSVSEGFDYDTVSGKFMGNIASAYNQFELDNITQKSIIGSNNRASNGYSNSGFILGYDSFTDLNGKKNLKISKSEAQIVKMIFQQFVSDKSMLSIAKFLNMRGYRTKAGNKFSAVSIRDILNNSTYIGHTKYGKYKNYKKLGKAGLNVENMIDVPGKHHPIISNDVWNAAQKIIKNKYGGKNSSHPLYNILRCPKCNSGMKISYTNNKGKSIRYYSCKRGSKNGCSANSIRANLAEDLVARTLINHMLYPSIRKKIVKKFNEYKEMENKEVSNIINNKTEVINNLKSQLNRLKEAEKDEFLAEAIQPEIDSIEEE
ncbi:recombinase family protein [Apilactobacillus micheneri]|uniref:Recombinase family protein n=1 Tax=Apilactobacillus micheneri TaxID=1899430 RepID=A0ABY2YZ70_9LACO|nr:recombinase family protein [Apilactobacillus micheneri]TPR26245.1 recombinase family protein [Apilactobacillus micheneri]TPR26999.1 recombinase family protein [Apilactobacillus micheneri]TPR27857.1 recombinase family protein [Apilactobacillus micheneri]TPR31762.1 recombinase family protein [Apilactobacillus micheneri]TPR32166.1 recombinase family protein [Apilactobacillus micheneri]